MKVYQTNEIKNIALLGSAGSGKTTLAESMLYEAGIIKRRGTVEAKNTVSDYFPVEQEYGYSVFSTVFHVEWNGKKLNVIDCPGSDDFVGGAITALNVTDQAVILINGQYGPEVGTQNAFRYTDKSRRVTVRLTSDASRAKIEVTDYGQGIPKSELENIWERYYTFRQRKGRGVSGLGLAIVRQTVDMFGGKCYVLSEEGKGSTFCIEFDKC